MMRFNIGQQYYLIVSSSSTIREVARGPITESWTASTFHDLRHLNRKKHGRILSFVALTNHDWLSFKNSLQTPRIMATTRSSGFWKCLLIDVSSCLVVISCSSPLTDRQTAYFLWKGGLPALATKRWSLEGLLRPSMLPGIHPQGLHLHNVDSGPGCLLIQRRKDNWWKCCEACGFTWHEQHANQSDARDECVSGATSSVQPLWLAASVSGDEPPSSGNRKESYLRFLPGTRSWGFTP
jgi:hypothetical protein